ncbi:MAG: hypothetical protein IJR60_02620 [Eubacterium sp.]|nr:hypothetical protein [Eubacterium sp.]
MKKLRVKLENCYGIPKFDYEFDFENKNAYVIYASNGLMKTSITKTFDAICNGESPVEEIFGRTPSFSITDESGNPITNENTLVVKSYDESYSSKNLSALIMKEHLKIDYDRITKSILEEKERFIQKMDYKFNKGTSFESEFNSTYNCENMLDKLEKIMDSGIGKIYPLDFTTINYADVFNDKVKAFIDKNFKELVEYKNEYEELVNNCKYFKQGTFSQYNANNVYSSLDENGYFNAGHTLVLNDNSQIVSADEFNALIESEKQKVFSDPKLLKKFEKIDKSLSKNAQLRVFRNIIENHLELVSELVPFDSFKKKCWNSILNSHMSDINLLISEYKKAKYDIKKIQDEANKQSDDWKYVIDIFSKRFKVPFTVSIGNQEDVILRNEVPSFVFKYKDDITNDEAIVDRSKLNDLLSGGERRALYLMNIVFELEALKKENKKALVICDDIAESFDYKNKHAIIEYLYENYNSDNFKFLILTHNFDFFRTISSRLLSTDRHYSLMAYLDANHNEIKLRQGMYLNSVFNYWHKNIRNNDSITLAVIPFIRNIIEYTKSTGDPDYLTLTNLLHYKPFSDTPTSDITFADLSTIVKKTWNDVEILDYKTPTDKVFNLLIDTAKDLTSNKTDDLFTLEDKIVVSMAIRLIGEKILIEKLIDAGVMEDDIKNINKNQTGILVDMYKNHYGRDDDMIQIIQPVLLFTSENIHINSFMYEPLIDTSPNELKMTFGTLILGFEE